MSEHKDREPPPPGHGAAQQQHGFMRRVALVDGIALLFILGLAAMWFAADALLLVFACILFAILLYELAHIAGRRLHVSHKVALVVVVTLLFLVIGLGGWLMAPQISEQASRLAATVPESLQGLRSALEQHPLLKQIASGLPSPEQIGAYLKSMVPNAGLFFSGVAGAVGNAVIIIFVGIYFAAQPTLYTEGMVKFIPRRKRERVREVLHEIGRTLAKWLIGKSLSMLIVGAVTAIGLALLGVPLALILGIIAGLLDFIPYLGPILAGVPAVLIAFSISPELALYTILLIGGVQVIEGYLLQPLIEAKAVSMPPALTIVMQLLFGAVFGLAGVALATPLTAALAVIVGMLYIEDVLGEQAKPPPTEEPAA